MTTAVNHHDQLPTVALIPGQQPVSSSTPSQSFTTPLGSPQPQAVIVQDVTQPAGSPASQPVDPLPSQPVDSSFDAEGVKKEDEAPIAVCQPSEQSVSAVPECSVGERDCKEEVATVTRPAQPPLPSAASTDTSPSEPQALVADQIAPSTQDTPAAAAAAAASAIPSPASFCLAPPPLLSPVPVPASAVQAGPAQSSLAALSAPAVAQDAQLSTTSLSSELGEEDSNDQSGIDHLDPLDPTAISKSTTSLSPLSDLSPRSPDESHVTTQPVALNPISPSPRNSPLSSSMRAPSPTMHGNGSPHPHPLEASPHLNGNRLDPNGEAALKRSRLDSELSAKADTRLPSLSQQPSTSQASPPLPSALGNQAFAADPRSTSMADQDGLVPGSSGTRFTKDQHRFAISVLKQLKRHRHAGPFLHPVDCVALNIPDYPLVVKQPMDLATIETRLGKVGRPCFYRSTEEFIADVQLVFTNCYTYNGTPDVSQYSRMALELSMQFDSQMKKMPPDEPVANASTSRSPSLVKPLPKVKQTPADPQSASAAAKRKNGSQVIAGTNGSQKRRSSSPQIARKKAVKTGSYSTPGSQDVPLNGSAHVGPSQHARFGGSSAARRASLNPEPASSNRSRRETKDLDHQYEAFVSNAPNVLKFCKEVLREVNKKCYESFVWPFYAPVDHVKLGIPDYPRIIKRPMDLQTMKSKLDRGEYGSGAAFEDDFRLILNNCFLFNPPGTTVNNCGKQLEAWFDTKWTERPPEVIEAPVPSVPPVTSRPENDSHALQLLQMQVAQLQEKMGSIDATKTTARSSSAHIIPGTGPPKKQPSSRAVAQSKNLPNINTAGVAAPASAASAGPRASKSNGGGPSKSKSSAAAAARRKSAAQSQTSAKRQPQPHEQLQERQQDHRQHYLAQQQYAMPNTAVDMTNPITHTPVPASRGLPDDEYFEKIDYEQKKDLATQIQNAVEPMQSDAINLIRCSRPDLVAADGEEIELDIDALDDRTLYRLYQLVCAPPPPPVPPKKKKPTKSTAGNGKAHVGNKLGGSAAARKPVTPLAPTTLPPSATTQSPGVTSVLAAAAAAEARAAFPWTDAEASAAVANGNGNGTKAKPKKPRTSGGGVKRKAIDEVEVSAQINSLEQKLQTIKGMERSTATHPQNGSAAATAAALVGSTSHAPPAGPVEYASSSSESDSDSDDESD